MARVTPRGSRNSVAVALRPCWLPTLSQVVDGTRTVLLKVDRPYPYGEKEDAFKEFAKLAGSLSVEDSKGFLIAEVNVQNYGDKDNAVVQERLRRLSGQRLLRAVVLRSTTPTATLAATPAARLGVRIF